MLRVWLRQISAAPSLITTMFAATLVAAVIATGAPRLLEQVSDDDLKDAIASVEPEERNITVSRDHRIGAGSRAEPFNYVGRNGTRFLEEDFPTSVASVVHDQRFVVDSPPYKVSSFPDDVEGPFPTTFRFRYQDGIEEQLTIVSGHMPERRARVPMLEGPDCPEDPLATDDFEADPEVRCSLVHVPVYEVVVTEATAEAMMISVGDDVLLGADASDPAWTFAIGDVLTRRLILSISGVVELSEPGLEYWYADTALHQPVINENADFRMISATGLMRPDTYRELLHDTFAVNFDYTWRYFVDPALVDQDQADDLAIDLEKIAPRDAAVSTLLPRVIDEFVEQRAQTVALMSTTVAGVLVVAVAVIFMLASLWDQRQRAATVLMIDRGGSRVQTLLGATRHAVVAVIPATAGGLAIGWFLVPDVSAPLSVRAALALGGGGVIAVVVATSRGSAARSIAPAADEPEATVSTARRFVRDAFVVVAGAGALVLLRRRGSIDESRDVDLEFDLLLAVAPAVVGLAVGLVALRLYTPLVRFCARIGARDPGPVPMVGFRRLARQSLAAQTPFIVILLAVGVAIFSSVVGASIASGQADHAWQAVGADYRVSAHASGVPLPRTVDARDLDVDSAALGTLYPEAVVTASGDSTSVNLLAVAVADHREILSGSPADPSVLDPIAGDLGSGDDRPPPLPALVSPGLDAGDSSVLELALGAQSSRATVAAVVDRFPGLRPDTPFVIVNLDHLRAVVETVPTAPTTLFLRAADSAGPEIESHLEEVAPTTHVTARHESMDSVAGDPFARWVNRGLGLVRVFAISLAGLAAVSVLAVTSNTRSREIGLLRTLGLGARQATALTALEQVLPVALALIVGCGFGIGVAYLLAPALDLEAFTGGVLPVDLVVEAAPVLGAVAVLMLVLTLAVVAALRFDRSPKRCHHVESRRRVDGRDARLSQPGESRYRRAGSIRWRRRDRVRQPGEDLQGPLHLEAVALQGLDLVVEQGEFVAIVGASGSGKSTLLNILGALDIPSAGEARVAGFDLLKMGTRERVRYRRRVVGFVWQKTARNLLPYLTALENVELPIMLARGSARTRRRRAGELLEQVGLAERLHHRPREMSGGEQQRVAIAVAMANEPLVVLADEPTGELDTGTAADVLEALKAVNEQRDVTIVVVTHDPLVAGGVNRTVAIRDGRTSSEVLRRTELNDQGGHEVVAEEFAVLDRVGRLQLPHEYVDALELENRVRLTLDPDHINVWPDRSDTGGARDD